MYVLLALEKMTLSCPRNTTWRFMAITKGDRHDTYDVPHPPSWLLGFHLVCLGALRIGYFTKPLSSKTRSWEVTDDHRSHWEFFQSIFKNFLLTEGPSGRSAMLVRIRLRPLAVSAIQERPPGATPDRSPLDLLGNELGHQILDKLVSFFSCPITLVRGVPRCTLYTFATLPHGICKEKK